MSDESATAITGIISCVDITDAECPECCVSCHYEWDYGYGEGMGPTAKAYDLNDKFSLCCTVATWVDALPEERIRAMVRALLGSTLPP
jgi:hypothetical protein